jgi:hypothetical protein
MQVQSLQTNSNLRQGKPPGSGEPYSQAQLPTYHDECKPAPAAGYYTYKISVGTEATRLDLLRRCHLQRQTVLGDVRQQVRHISEVPTGG